MGHVVYFFKEQRIFIDFISVLTYPIYRTNEKE